MKNNSAIIYRIVLVLGDFLALIAAFGVAYIWRVKLDDRPLINQIPAETYLYSMLIVLPIWIIIHGAIGLYSRPVYENRFLELGKLILGSVLGILTVVGYDFAADQNLFPARLVPVYGFLIGLGFLIIFRTLARIGRLILFSFDVGIQNLIIVGGGSYSEKIIKQLSHTPKTGYRVMGVIEETEIDKLAHLLDKNRIDSIVQTKLFKDDEKNSEILALAQRNHIQYRFMPGSSEIYSGNIEVELFREIPVITVHQTALFGWGQVVKRGFDILVGVLLLIVFSPLILLVSLLQKVFDPKGDILLRQTRLTQFDRKFKVYKFRSHVSTYSGLSPEEAFKKMGSPELAKIYRENGDHLKNDPRVTAFGKILRLTSIDELPQLINVVQGDLSLVGPRALVPDELNKYHQKHHILSVKSGMTGLAQVSGRRDISFEERRKLDVYYVQNWSFWLDIVILLKTLRAVLGGSGAK